MRTKISTLKHPSGLELKTPLLIPSYSSKGFGIDIIDKKEISEITEVMLVCREFLAESSLVSAYDLHYNLIPQPDDFISTDITFIDSGGYETSNSYDFSTTMKYNHNVKEWNKNLLVETLKSWPSYHPAAIVSFDNFKPFKEQVKEARLFFEDFSNIALTDFLIKPEKGKNLEVNITEVEKNVSLLEPFDIIGFTEKELGNSILKRMKNIQRIRSALDAKKIYTPIHIFGSLDPITSSLYFLSGAEIFDGLTWIRYSYLDGLSMYPQNYGIIEKELGIHSSKKDVMLRSLTSNIYFLNRMKWVLIDFHNTKDYNLFNELGGKKFTEILKRSLKSIEEKRK